MTTRIGKCSINFLFFFFFSLTRWLFQVKPKLTRLRGELAKHFWNLINPFCYVFQPGKGQLYKKISEIVYLRKILTFFICRKNWNGTNEFFLSSSGSHRLSQLHASFERSLLYRLFTTRYGRQNGQRFGRCCR